MNWLHIHMHLIISSLWTIFVLESIAFFSLIHLAHINFWNQNTLVSDEESHNS